MVEITVGFIAKLIKFQLQGFSFRQDTSKTLGRPSFFFFFGLFRVTLKAHGGSQARGRIGAVAAGIYHSHSKVGFPAVSVTYNTAHSNAGSLSH